MSIFSVGASTPSDEGFELKSCRFDDGSTTQLSWTPSIAVCDMKIYEGDKFLSKEVSMLLNTSFVVASPLLCSSAPSHVSTQVRIALGNE